MSYTTKVDFLFGTAVSQICVDHGAVSRVALNGGKTVGAGYVIVAAGRKGLSWLSEEAKRLGPSLRKNLVDIDFRIELPAPIKKRSA